MMLEKSPQHKDKTCRGFVKAALLAAALVGCGGSATLTTARPAIQQPAHERISISCRGRTSDFSEGETLSMGLTQGVSYHFKFDRIARDSILSDVTVPVVRARGRTLVSMGITFNDVEMSRRSFGSVTSSICQQIETIERLTRPQSGIITAQSLHSGAILAKAPDTVAAQDRQFGEIDLGELLRGILVTAPFNHAAAHVGLMRSGSLGDGTEFSVFTVAGSNEREFSIRLQGEEYRMDRRIDLSVEQLTSVPAYLFLPLRIQSLAVEEGRFQILIVSDCSRQGVLGLGDERVQVENCR